MPQFTEAMRRAIDASPMQPARCTDPTTGQQMVLLASADFDWIRRTLGDEPDAVRIRDPRTQHEYAMLMPERYERFKAFFEEDPLSPAEKGELLRAAGRRAGWDDRAFDEIDTQESK
jgi:hypothetical protein